jgi:hypothetical protein
MLTLYSYPSLFGCADNNPFGLKVYAFLKLCGLPFRHEHILDVSYAPRAQLPYLTDGVARLGYHVPDSGAIRQAIRQARQERSNRRRGDQRRRVAARDALGCGQDRPAPG